jgi:lysophospholipase L1-like esterase
MWIGNNDALIADELSTPLAMTPVESTTAPCPTTLPATTPYFLCQYEQTIGALAATKAQLFVGNIPDVTLVPYLVPGWQVIGQVEEESGLPEPEVEGILGLLPTDYINLETYADIPAIVACALGGAPCPLDNPGTYGPEDPGSCPSNLTAIAPGVTYCILHAADITTIQETVGAYNEIIDEVAAGTHATVVDINSVFATDYASGLTVNGCTATYGFLGGLFGLDGVHPTNTGYGVLANAFISAINTADKSSIAMVDLATIAAKDPLWPSNITGDTQCTAAVARHNGRPVGKLPTYAQAKLISDAVMKTISPEAKARIAAQFAARKKALK